MEAVQFRHAMETFAKDRNIPLRDILTTIDQVGLESRTVPDDQKPAFFQRAYMMFCMGFPTALPAGTKSLYEEDSTSE